MTKERPILFSGAMVRALLDGTKAQTRRIVKGASSVMLHHVGGVDVTAEEVRRRFRCPYGVVGDRLWVCETWCLAHDEWAHNEPPADGRPSSPEGEGVYYRATEPECETPEGRSPWRPSIHMPRWASRITLEVTDVRVQRLQDISEEDARAEGARRFDDIPDVSPYGTGPRWSMESPTSTAQCLGSPQMAFANLWNRINGEGAWDANPWVWAISFKRVQP